MSGKTHISNQHFQDDFDTNGFSSVIYNRCSVTMSYSKKDFMGPLKTLWCVINRVEGQKLNRIYEFIIPSTIHDDSSHPHWVEIPNSLYVLIGREQLISPQHWAQNSTWANAGSTTMDGTQYVTHYDWATLIWGGGKFVCTIPLEKRFFHSTLCPWIHCIHYIFCYC